MTDLLQNLLYAGRPDERLGSIVVSSDELLDGRDQIGNTREGAATAALIGQFTKPSFDEVEPRRGGRCEVQVEARMLGQPVLDLRMFVRRVVVQDHGDVKLRGDILIDRRQDLAELDVAMPRIAGADDRARKRVKG